MRNWKRLLLIVSAFGLLTAAYERIHSPSIMADAARAYLAALTPELRARATYPFESEERSNWAFIPLDNRKGVALREMTPEQKHLAEALVSAGLSQQGIIKAHTIMSLEQVLKVKEAAAAKAKQKSEGLERDPEKYFLTIFGDPSEKGRWGYRFEGHHISMNMSILDGKIASSPNFFGSNPAEVKEGPRKGLRALPREEDIAHDLIQALSEQQRATAIVDKTALKDIVTSNMRKAALKGQPNGLPFSKLNAKQKEILTDLVNEYASNFPPMVAEARMEQYRKSQDKLFFAWTGGIERTDPHYYRIQTPSFLIEYDKTQDNGNHIHSVWRDFDGDFGMDMLGQHYQASKH